MEKATAVAAQYETIGRGLILLGAFVSFVLSVGLWFTDQFPNPRIGRLTASPSC